MSFFNHGEHENRRRTEKLESLKDDEYVQLDGSEWARLANQRLHRQRHLQEAERQNLLDSPRVIKEQISSEHHTDAQTAKNHWFCPISTTYQCHDSAEIRAAELLDSRRLNEVLENVDQSWAPISNDKTSDDSGEYWSDRERETIESRASGNWHFVKEHRPFRKT